jgi:hypothetical protein
MSLATLSTVKANLGIADSDTSEDTALTRWLGAAATLIRNYLGRKLGGLIQSNTVAAATVITAAGHGLTTGDTIVIAGSNSTPTIDGERVVTVLTADTFTVPVTVTVAGSAGYWTNKLTEYYCGPNDPTLVLRESPVVSISSVYLDSGAYFAQASGAFAADTLLTAGVDYALDARRGFLVKIGGVWPGVNAQARGLLASGVTEGVGNIRVTGIYGYAPIPADLQLAACQVVAEMKASARLGGALSSERTDYYSYTRASAADVSTMLGSSMSILAGYGGKKWVI